MKTKLNLLLLLFYFSASFTTVGQAHSQLKGSVERIKVYGKSLEGNLAGDSPKRDVSIYLPPSYNKDANRRYPVVYFLHGFTDNDAKVFALEPHWMSMPNVLDKAFSTGNVNEMIIITPNAFTKFSGSMYSNSITTGNWEEYIAKELVDYIDGHYRTIPQASSRGLAGHSMGGYGAMRIGQKFPEVFSSIYLLSPCCLAPGNNTIQNTEAIARLEAIASFEDLNNADFFTKAAFASAAAWSPNPTKPPFYLDHPYGNDTHQALVMAKWHANQPLATIDQNIYNIKKLTAIAFDAGNEDRGIAASIKVLNKILDDYGVKHFYEEYQGDHLNRIAERIETKMLVFFAENLSFIQPKKK